MTLTQPAQLLTQQSQHHILSASSPQVHCSSVYILLVCRSKHASATCTYTPMRNACISYLQIMSTPQGLFTTPHHQVINAIQEGLGSTTSVTSLPQRYDPLTMQGTGLVHNVQHQGGQPGTGWYTITGITVPIYRNSTSQYIIRTVLCIHRNGMNRQ